ncbi:hypothetical protein IHV12_14325 [Fictibacillus sp. 7GRE50]|jgi:hypothetical protein|uniref:hypothetical protein n=1 Tax=Fictibacillus TaxID=1329200 RepID=UPI0018CC9D5E|nr:MULTISPECIES: hypothetical protein [unclassified Fictibacillus]MBH0166096.1 hypothetical protein [Fictibacillus sp. 7GRE50]MBH0172855.1 hypothetical protein [Fictibacillus sp. 23RED33]
MAIFGTQNLRARLIQAARLATNIDVIYVPTTQVAAAPDLTAVTITEVQADFIIVNDGTVNYLVPIDKIITIQDISI